MKVIHITLLTVATLAGVSDQACARSTKRANATLSFPAPKVTIDPPWTYRAQPPSVSRETYVGTAQTAAGVAAVAATVAVTRRPVANGAIPIIASQLAGSAAAKNYDQSGGTYYMRSKSSGVQTTSPYMYQPPKVNGK